MKVKTILLLFLLSHLLAPLQASEFYVDCKMGSDTAKGSKTAPFKTITRAAKELTPGDTLNVIPGKTAWPEQVNLYGLKGGEPGKPIVIDGHGVWLTGADPIPPGEWKEEANGLWSHTGMAYTKFLVVDGKLVLETMNYSTLKPGELCYSVKAYNRLFYKREGKIIPEMQVGQPDGSTISLDPKKWQQSGLPGGIVRYNKLKTPTWVKVGDVKKPLVRAKERLAPGQFCIDGKTLYYFPPAGKRPGEMKIEAVVRTNGIQLSGKTRNVIIRNFNVRNVANDGYNIHGAVKGVEFYNCNARDCGDEGFSAHDQCETLLDGAVYVNCDNGITNVNKCKSITRNVICVSSRTTGYEAQQQSEHIIENLILIDNPHQLGSGGSSLTADNILILRTSGGVATRAINGKNKLNLKRVTIVNNTNLLRLVGEVDCRIENSLIGGNQGIIHVGQDKPKDLIKLEGVKFGGGITMEWGARQPFKREPLVDWVKKSIKTGVSLIDTKALDALTKGEIPKDIPKGGCSLDLLKRAMKFLKNNSISNSSK